jgi:alpha-amylase
MVKLILALHNHQPVGNFDSVLEEAYDLSYKPFFDVLERHPGVRVSAHFSGILYDWLEKAHPDYLDRLAGLVKAGRLEVLSGGYYEPILALLPEEDRRGQVNMMRDYVRARFGQDPCGLWLAERVWEPELAGSLAAMGVGYTALDDVHFFSAGFDEKALTGRFTTEYGGRHLDVFPINHRLRYLMPFAEPQKVIDYLKGFEGQDAELVMADDGEKFGLWPGTHEHVYTKGWLDRMFDLLEKNSAWVSTARFSDCLEGPSKGLAYLPTTSYHELSQWALPPERSRRLAGLWEDSPEDFRQFLRGGYFRNFFSKYPESNRLYRRMLRASARVRASGSNHGLRALYKAQCNCGYWHGVFGGVYLPHIRMAVYKNALEAEGSLPARAGTPRFELAREDWDADGRPELLAEGEKANFYFSPAKGGGLWEWDYKPRGVNLGSVVWRHPEAYHEGEAKNIAPNEKRRAAEAELKKNLFYDWHPRMCLLDHFLHPDTTPEAFMKASYGEQGDFVTGEYSCTHSEGHAGLTLKFRREGSVWSGGASAPVRVEKDVLLRHDGSWKADYKISNLGQHKAEVWAGTELALAFSGKERCPAAEYKGVTRQAFPDPYYGGVELEFSEPLDLWAFPLETVSRSEEGAEKTYQGSVLLANSRRALEPGASFSFSLEARPL